MSEDVIRVNFSDTEASSTPRDVEPLPTGKYLCHITDCALAFVGSGDNEGEPMYKFEFTVIDDARNGQYKNRKIWTNAMLFRAKSGKDTMFTISQLLQSQGIEVTPGAFDVPGAEWWLDDGSGGRRTVLVGGSRRGESKDKNDPNKTYPPRFDASAFWPASAWKKSPGGPVITGANSSTPAPAKPAVTFLPTQ
jgi:hypothetical protein